MRRAAIFGVSVVVTCVFFINLCAVMFRCGCRSAWAGGGTHCNIHTAGVRHCPWCSYGVPGEAAAFFAIVAAQLAVALWPGHCDWRLRLLLTVAAFPAAGALVAAAYGILSGYWR